MKKESFYVQGMTCSSCQINVEKAVRTIDGVKLVNVNLLSNIMVVEYDENIIDNKKIIDTVTNAGYIATIYNQNYNDKTSNNEKNIDKNKKNLKLIKKRLIFSFCFLIPLMYIAMYQMLNNMFGLPIPNIIKEVFEGPQNALKFSIVQVILLIPIIILNRNYFIIGFKRLLKGVPNMDSLIAIGSISAILYGFWSIFSIIIGLNAGDYTYVEKYVKDLYFESAGTILTLITFGKYLEQKSKGKTSEAISKLISLSPKTATILKGNEEIEIKVEEIVKQDIVIIKPGESIPVDGIVIAGNSSIDQSSITGESIPVNKTVGDSVISGTINRNGILKVEAIKVGENTTLSQIIKLVEEASNSKAQISKIVDKISSIFVPSVIIISIITFVIWLVCGQSLEFALTSAISVLVISCPCALGLATPVAIMVGTGKGAENGILIKDAECLELLHNVDTVVLDKTGTITNGTPKVVDIITSQTLLGSTSSLNNGRIKIIGNLNYNLKVENELLKIAGSLEKNSEHPLATAIVERAVQNNVDFAEVEAFESITGSGIKGKINNITYFGGNFSFMKENGINIDNVSTKVTELSNQGKTILYFAKEKNLIGIIAVADTIKESSVDAIKYLKNKNLEVIMLTGDNKQTAEYIGKRLSLDKIISELLPQDKENEITKLQKSGKKVVFIGDGINDSPALMRADVGISIGNGTDIAIESADIVLMKNDLRDVDTVIELSKSIIKNIKMNLFWAFFYNIIGIPVAAGLFYPIWGLKLNPMLGAAAMSFSSVCVVTNALRLRKFRNKNFTNNNENFQKIEEKKHIINQENSNIKKEKLIIEKNIKSEIVTLGQNQIKKRIKENKIMKKISINGMNCNHCKMSVEKALRSVEGVEKVDVSLENKCAVITLSKEVENSVLKGVIEEAGFEVIEIA